MTCGWGRGETEKGHGTSAGTVVIHVDTCISTETGSGENIPRGVIEGALQGPIITLA